MAIKLGKNPESFKKEISLVTVEGVTEILTIDYRYRTRRQFAAWLDERSKDKIEPLPDDATIETSYLARTELAAETVLDIAKGWDLSDDFTVENLQVLEDQFPGALNAIQIAYQSAVMDERVKN